MPRLKAPQRREQLLEVATKLFARSGYDATTTAAIAEAAGVTEPILYRHFKSKQDLFMAILRRLSAQTLEQWRAMIADITDPADQIRRIGREFAAQIYKLEAHYHVLHGALATSNDKKVLGVMKEHYREIHSFFTGIIREGQARGQFRQDVNPATAAWGLIYTGIGYAMMTLNLSVFDDMQVEPLIESQVRGLGS
jgi:AcrR family transcriptional regulator